MQRNPRTTAILAVAKANGLDIETVVVDTVNPTPEFLKLNPLSKVPVFVGTDGYVLTESIAIAIYRKTSLLLEEPNTATSAQSFPSPFRQCEIGALP